MRFVLRASLVGCLLLGWGASSFAAEADEVPTVHGLALYDEPALPGGFSHFPHVVPDAPKGGSMTQAAVGSSFDSTNPFIIRGTPAIGIGEIYDTLLVENPGEPFSAYGLLAEGIRLDPDRYWIEFDLHPAARFHDGEPVTAEDVVYSFHLLRDEGNPFYRGYYADVESVEALDPHTVRFEFAANHSRELPLIVGQLPILPKHYWEERDFSSPTLARHPGSGPYRIAEVDPGRRIVYERVDDYWGRDLPVNVGRHNIDRLIYDYYRDRDIAWEAFKAGVMDYRIDARAATWAIGYDFPAYREGLVKRITVPDGQPSRMQAFVFNLRRDKFQDPRVREALNLTFDFPWLNANIFYDTYRRTESYFQNSDMAAEGKPSDAELELLEPFRDVLPARVFDEALPIDHPDDLRERLRLAYDLLIEAGYEVRDDTLVDAESGRPLAVEVMLFDSGMERVVQPMLRNMSRLGIHGTLRIVDINQYLNRLRSFDFDIIVGQFPQSNNPGNEQREYWTSEFADSPQSRNLMGLEHPAVDTLVAQLIRADSREELNTVARALDRVLRWEFITIPQYHSGETRIAVWDKFGYPEPFPEYGLDLAAWWVDAEREAEINQRLRRR
ncbi:ABC transporter substrate-binding protein [Halomonas sp. MCCC 1A17488]|uniref:ABC transporter substrate-binding protein n=1 Tax=Billgrantia sulfidoxydans TaxID=2733484 RepID=A0ABX7W5U7_9GAMM|nr:MULTISPECIES: extracellular solute-binding protein [Halomonas]MCE8015181.1 ABC transporter substrate-binding protein [Halomonas sp. MCCC 1A17488]MCG3238514.1 ABC transporter substrate-binding protein [Halomonas sp. MCCC 1A17488]QPP47745.1 ABC transporter substrate-binding protein [Halomonas sp. SS10-MC5]QTP55052.1 ABC transporter substrate-binding protein [Halomonas sulfidoxydans]